MTTTKRDKYMYPLKTIINEYLLICQENRKLSPHTIKAYKIDLTQFSKQVGYEIEITKVEKKHIQQFHQYLASRNLAPISIKRKLACLKAMFRWLELEEIIETSPFHKYRSNLKIPKRLPRNIPQRDLKSLLIHARQHEKHSFHSQPLPIIKTKRDLNKLTTLMTVELLLTTGVRISELANIKLSDIFLEEGKIKILGKGSRERFVYMPDKDLSSLVTYYRQVRSITETNSNTLLVNSRGKPASTQFLRKLIRILASEANTSLRITPHMFRHSAACELLASNLDIRLVQKLLGHSSISTTEIYTHVSDSLLQKRLQEANVRRKIMER